MIISDGYNGTPSGFENECEDENHYTKWYVLHAEANAILKVAASTQSCVGATVHYPPLQRVQQTHSSGGIKRVVYSLAYKDRSGPDFLEKAGNFNSIGLTVITKLAMKKNLVLFAIVFLSICIGYLLAVKKKF